MIKLFYFKHNKYNRAEYIRKTLIQFYELTFLIRGQMEYIVNGNEVVLHSGDIIYLKPGCYRERRAFSESDYVSFNFYTDAPPELPLHMSKIISNEIKLLLSASGEIYANMTDLNDFGCLDLLLQCIIMQIKQNMTVKKLSPLTIKIKDYIQAHVEEKITLESVSKAVFFSPVYCSSLFKKEMGKGIIEYVIDEKIRKAKNYIIEGVRLKDIAELVGFTDYNYFCRIFKKRVNYTPAQYRKATTPPPCEHESLALNCIPFAERIAGELFGPLPAFSANIRK